MIVNTRRGSKSAWHAKWLQMRHLAEWTRVLDFALPLGNPLTRFEQDPATDWISWRARAASRAVGTPSLSAGAATLAEMRDRLLGVVSYQSGYHRLVAARMHRIDRRTHRTSAVLFGGSLVAALTHLMLTLQIIGSGASVGPMPMELVSSATTMLSVALPALGSAIYGIRLMGDFENLAERSERFASELDRLRRTVESDPLDHGLISDRVWQLAAIMLSDTADWRRNFEGRPLTLPS